MNTANNQRYRDTERKMEQALLSLSRTCPAHKITVRQICAEAHINRSTFYAHFQDIPDMIHQVGRANIKRFLSLFDDTSEDELMLFFTDRLRLTGLLTYIRQNQEFFSSLLCGNSYEFVQTSLYQLWDRGAKSYMEKLGLTDEAEMEYHFAFFWAGFLAVLGRWLSGGCQKSPAFICNLLLSQIPQHCEKSGA